MRSLMQQMPYLGPAKKEPFRKAGMKEGPRMLREEEYGKVFSTFSRQSSGERLGRFTAARAAVQALGGSADIVREATGGLRLKMRMEFPTSDKTMDAELHKLVSGMGFELLLEGKPGDGPSRGMERTYVVTERRSGENLDYAHVRAEDLVRLDSMLCGRVRVSMAQLVPLPARVSAPSEAGSRDSEPMVAMQATR